MKHKNVVITLVVVTLALLGLTTLLYTHRLKSAARESVQELQRIFIAKQNVNHIDVLTNFSGTHPNLKLQGVIIRVPTEPFDNDDEKVVFRGVGWHINFSRHIDSDTKLIREKSIWIEALDTSLDTNKLIEDLGLKELRAYGAKLFKRGLVLGKPDKIYWSNNSAAFVLIVESTFCSGFVWPQGSDLGVFFDGQIESINDPQELIRFLSLTH